MIYIKTESKLQFNRFKQLVSVQSGGKLRFISKENFQILTEFFLGDFKYAIHFYDNKLVLSNLKDKHLEVLPNEMKILEHESLCYPIGENVFYNPSDKSFVYKDGFSIAIKSKDYSFESKVLGQILIECNLHKRENSSVKGTDLKNNEVIWEQNFPWHLVRLETYKSLIILEYHAYDKIRTDHGYEGERDWHNPNRYTIVLDSETGKEIWRYPNSYHNIDFENGVILTGWAKQSVNGEIKPSRVIELDTNSGAVLTEEIVKPALEGGRYYCFVDDEGIYYKTHEGSFGKINKSDGVILWEFDLLDTKGEKRKLSEWLLLGNGNLVLQAAPNHPNGDLTCIFNPQENMDLSNVKNGIRNI